MLPLQNVKELFDPIQHKDGFKEQCTDSFRIAPNVKNNKHGQQSRTASSGLPAVGSRHGQSPTQNNQHRAAEPLCPVTSFNANLSRHVTK